METNNSIYLSTDLTFNNVTEEDNFLKIEGYGAHFGVANLNNEIVTADSFGLFFDMYKGNKIKPVLNWNHDPNSVIGTVDEITSDTTGLFFRCSVNKGVKFCDENLCPNIRAGVINSFSTEGIIKNGYDGIVVNPDGSYLVKDFLLTALAVVSTPADWDAKFSVANMMRQTEPQKRSKWYLL